jgi:hypothetical protein
VANPVASHRLAACADIRHPHLAAVLHADEDEWILFFGGAVLIATSVVVVLSMMDGIRRISRWPATARHDDWHRARRLDWQHGHLDILLS